MKKTEKLFSRASQFDAKNITNKSNVILDKSIFDTIENGISIETLDKLQNEHNLKVFKYRTQITIHGLFPDTTGFYVGGYSSIFQNKNKSIGVKWRAIDSEKRDFLQAKLGFVGFSRIGDSQKDFFAIQKSVNESNFKQIRDELKKIYDKIDESLFYGSKDLYLATSQYGTKYVCLDLNINAIYTEKMQLLLDSLGYNKIEHEKQIEILRQEEKIRHDKYEKEREEREKKRIIAKEQVIKENERLATIYKKEVLKEGLYIKAVLPYGRDSLEYRAYRVKAKEGRRKARWTTDTFKTLSEALAFTSGYSEHVLQKEIEAFRV